MSEQDAYIKYIQNFFEKWAAFYDWFAASIFYAYRHAVKVAAPRSAMSILDICTGTGEIAVRCARAGAEVTGIDITEAMLERARKKSAGLSAKFLKMDARDLEFQDNTFDTAIISFGLHDMPRKVRLGVLAEATRVAQRVVILDYELPKNPILFKFWLWFISLFESPYFPSFAKEDPLVLFSEAGHPAVRMRRIFPNLFSVYVCGEGS